MLCLVQQNVHSLPKTFPVAIMVTNTPSSQRVTAHNVTRVAGAVLQSQPPRLPAVINDGTPPEKAASSESKSSKEPKDPLDDVVFTGETLTLGKKNSDGKTVSTEKKAIVIRYTDKQNSAEKVAPAKEVVPQKDSATSQKDGNVTRSQENGTQDESDDSEVSEDDEEEEEEDTDEEDDSQFFAPGAVDLLIRHVTSIANSSCA